MISKRIRDTLSQACMACSDRCVRMTALIGNRGQGDVQIHSRHVLVVHGYVHNRRLRRPIPPHAMGSDNCRGDDVLWNLLHGYAADYRWLSICRRVGSLRAEAVALRRPRTSSARFMGARSRACGLEQNSDPGTFAAAVGDI